MKILKLTKGIRKYILIMLVFSIIQVFCELYLPDLMSDIVDVGIENSDTSFIMNKAILMFVFTIACLISSVVVVYSTSKFANTYGYKIRKALYNKINTFPQTIIL